ncbi:MAG TPA: cyclic nucleotide-binding domain-containing protein [Acidimicrobiia bacterium]|nr:cyclic nucleotide-binding domain-containing protein [Acidimicrobiia bacterium]
MSAFFSGVTNDQLASVALLDGMDGEALERVKQCSYFIGAHPGLHIVREADAGFELYIVLSGTADVVRDGEIVASLGKGDVFGEMAVLSNAHRNADVRATSVMSLLAMSATDFRRLAKDFPELERRVRDLAEGRRAPTG